MFGMRVDARELPLHMQEQVALLFLEQSKFLENGKPGKYINKESVFAKGKEKRTEEIIGMMMETKTKVMGEQYLLLKELMCRVMEL